MTPESEDHGQSARAVNRKVRTKRVSLEKLQADRERTLAQLDRLEERKIAAATRLGAASRRYDEASRKHGSKSNELAGLNGIIHLTEKAEAVGYVAEDGAIKWWVMPDGSKVDASVPEEDL